jgi:hypothetical protein
MAEVTASELVKAGDHSWRRLPFDGPQLDQVLFDRVVVAWLRGGPAAGDIDPDPVESGLRID